MPLILDCWAGPVHPSTQCLLRAACMWHAGLESSLQAAGLLISRLGRGRCSWIVPFACMLCVPCTARLRCGAPGRQGCCWRRLRLGRSCVVFCRAPAMQSSLRVSVCVCTSAGLCSWRWRSTSPSMALAGAQCVRRCGGCSAAATCIYPFVHSNAQGGASRRSRVVAPPLRPKNKQKKSISALARVAVFAACILCGAQPRAPPVVFLV